MRECVDRESIHQQCKAEREAFKKANPDKYKIIPAGFSREIEKLTKAQKAQTAIDKRAKERGNVFRVMREDTGLSQKEFSKHVGLDSSWISKIEDGRVKNPVYLAKFRKAAAKLCGY